MSLPRIVLGSITFALIIACAPGRPPQEGQSCVASVEDPCSEGLRCAYQQSGRWACEALGLTALDAEPCASSSDCDAGLECVVDRTPYFTCRSDFFEIGTEICEDSFDDCGEGRECDAQQVCRARCLSSDDCAVGFTCAQFWIAEEGGVVDGFRACVMDSP